MFRRFLRTGCLLWIAAAGPVLADTDPSMLREQAQQLRRDADRQFSAEQAACLQRFLVNHCIDQARERRIAQIRRARSLEGEAGQLQRARREAERQARLKNPSNPSAAPGQAAVAAPIDPQIPAQGPDHPGNLPAEIPPPSEPPVTAPANVQPDAGRAEAEARARQRAQRAADDRAR